MSGFGAVVMEAGRVLSEEEQIELATRLNQEEHAAWLAEQEQIRAVEEASAAEEAAILAESRRTAEEDERRRREIAEYEAEQARILSAAHYRAEQGRSAEDPEIAAAIRRSLETAVTDEEERRFAEFVSDTFSLIVESKTVAPPSFASGLSGVIRAQIRPVNTGRRVVGRKVAISGSGANNCLLNAFVTAAGCTCLDIAQLRRGIAALVADRRSWILEANRAEQIMNNDQLGEVELAVLVDMLRKTTVVCNLDMITNVATVVVYGQKYDNWSGKALLHYGDVGIIEDGHFDMFDMTSGGPDSFSCVGAELPRICNDLTLDEW